MRLCGVAIVAALALMAGTARGQWQVTIPDGRRILLKDDQTWEFVGGQRENGSRQAVLSVVRKVPGSSSCGYGLKLDNTLDYPIESVVPQFSVYTKDNVLFDTKFQEFRDIRPRRSQYREVRFSGIRCDDVAAIKVHGGDRCRMGDLDKFSAVKGECLNRIRIEAGGIVSISK